MDDIGQFMMRLHPQRGREGAFVSAYVTRIPVRVPAALSARGGVGAGSELGSGESSAVMQDPHMNRS